MPKSNTRNKYYYKIVCNQNGELKSWHVGSQSIFPYRTVTYSLGNWVSAPSTTRLFVFRTLAEARAFLAISGPIKASYQIYRCKIIGGIESSGGSNIITAHQLKQFWATFNKLRRAKKSFTAGRIQQELDKHSGSIWVNAVNAVLVKKVKLISRVKQ